MTNKNEKEVLSMDPVIQSDSVISVEVVQLIKVKTRAGKGTEENPNRIETGLWSLSGKFIADVTNQDPL